MHLVVIGLYSYGLYSYGLCSYGPDSYGLYTSVYLGRAHAWPIRLRIGTPTQDCALVHAPVYTAVYSTGMYAHRSVEV